MFIGILGVNFHEVFAIIVLVISVLSWLVNLIQGNSPNGMPRQQKPKPKPQSARSELEELIHELTTDKRKLEKRSEAPPAAKPRSERPRPPASTVPQRPGNPPPYTPSRQSPQVADPKRPAPNRIASNLGEGMRAHHVGTRIEASAPTTMPSSAPAALENRSPVSITSPEKQTHPLVKFLREPGGVRQAVILNEILQRPKSLRH